MYEDTIESFSRSAVKKAQFVRKDILRYFILSILAGIYVGFGIMLIFSIGAPFAHANSPAVKILMGVSFGIALTLVIIAGAELFTGNNMVMIIGNMTGRSSISDTALVWIVSLIGNLAGSLLFSFLCVQTGLFKNTALLEFTNNVVAMKMNAPLIELFTRGILCNMLVCLAIWMSARVKDDTARILVIFWCLFAFIASGFEHSVANMSLLGFPLLSGDYAGISWYGYFRNIGIVVLGNIVGGGLMIGAAYAFVSVKRDKTGGK